MNEQRVVDQKRIFKLIAWLMLNEDDLIIHERMQLSFNFNGKIVAADMRVNFEPFGRRDLKDPGALVERLADDIWWRLGNEWKHSNGRLVQR